jgi:hypothetical protein
LGSPTKPTVIDFLICEDKAKIIKAKWISS